MVLSPGSNGVFCLPDLHFCEFGINEFGVSEAAKFVAHHGKRLSPSAGARSIGNDSASPRRAISRSMTGVACEKRGSPGRLSGRMGRANGSRECAPDDRLRETHRIFVVQPVMGIASLNPSYGLGDVSSLFDGDRKAIGLLAIGV